MNNFARRATIAMKNRRMMSGAHHNEEEVHKEMGKWYKMTLPKASICQLDMYYMTMSWKYWRTFQPRMTCKRWIPKNLQMYQQGMRCN